MKKAKKKAAPKKPEVIHMTTDEFRAAVDINGKLKISQEGFGRLLAVRGRTVRSWASGEYPVPKVVALLVRLMVKHKIAAADLS
ncbi:MULTISPECIES: hypothetical protein [unclassified Bradyrhizobium]|uniref:hypothetical protein n=1 Tax=unclassified Bradyrhizobium TaxID=2631580 RepID=UPI002FF1F091